MLPLIRPRSGLTGGEVSLNSITMYWIINRVRVAVAVTVIATTKGGPLGLSFWLLQRIETKTVEDKSTRN